MNHSAMPAATPRCAGPDPIDYARYRAAGGYRLLQACAAGRHDGAMVRQRLGAAREAAPQVRRLLVAVQPGARDAGADRRLLEDDPHRFIEGLQLACWALELDEAHVLLQPEHAVCGEWLAHEIDLMRQELPVAGLPAIVLRTVPDADAEPAALRCEVPSLWRLRARIEGAGGVSATRTFDVTGPVRDPGRKRVPEGTPLPMLVDRYCGGMAGGERLYAALVGCAVVVPAQGADMPLPGGEGGAQPLHVLAARDGVLPAVRELLAREPAATGAGHSDCHQAFAHAHALLGTAVWTPALLRATATRLRAAPACACARAAADALDALLLHFRAEVQ